MHKCVCVRVCVCMCVWERECVCEWKRLQPIQWFRHILKKCSSTLWVSVCVCVCVCECVCICLTVSSHYMLFWKSSNVMISCRRAKQNCDCCNTLQHTSTHSQKITSTYIILQRKKIHSVICWLMREISCNFSFKGNESHSQMNESCRTDKWVMSHRWMSHVSQMNGSCLTDG